MSAPSVPSPTQTDPSAKVSPKHSSEAIPGDADEDIERNDDMSRNVGLLTTSAAIAVNQRGLSSTPGSMFVANYVKCHENGMHYQVDALSIMTKHTNTEQVVEP